MSFVCIASTKKWLKPSNDHQRKYMSMETLFCYMSAWTWSFQLYHLQDSFLWPTLSIHHHTSEDIRWGFGGLFLWTTITTFRNKEWHPILPWIWLPFWGEKQREMSLFSINMRTRYAENLTLCHLGEANLFAFLSFPLPLQSHNSGVLLAPHRTCVHVGCHSSGRVYFKFSSITEQRAAVKIP